MDDLLNQVLTATEADELFGKQSGTTRRAIFEGRLASRKSGGTHLILRSDAEEYYKMQHDQVKLTHNDKPRCPVHGEQNTQYQAQDPAPCGCAWVWEDNKLIAVPKR